MNWYFEQDGVSQGPHSEEELAALVRSGAVAAHHLIWQVGMGKLGQRPAPTPAVAQERQRHHSTRDRG